MVGVELGQAAAEQRSHALLDTLQAPSHVLTKNLSAVVRACLLPGRVADELDLLGVAGRRIDRRQDRFLVPVAAEFFGWQARRASATATSPSSPTSTTSTIRHRAHGDLPPLPQGEEWLSEYDPTRGEWGWVSTMDFPEESLRRPAPTARRERRQPVNSVTHRPGRPSPRVARPGRGRRTAHDTHRNTGVGAEDNHDVRQDDPGAPPDVLGRVTSLTPTAVSRTTLTHGHLTGDLMPAFIPPRPHPSPLAAYAAEPGDCADPCPQSHRQSLERPGSRSSWRGRLRHSHHAPESVRGGVVRPRRRGRRG